MQKAATAYLQTQVSSTSQADLLIMLYDAAIKFLKQAKEKIAERDYAAKGVRISKALDVINELQGSLNCQKGGDLAENLNRLYFYCSTRLLQANLKMDVKFIDEVVTILSELRDAFIQINKGGAQAGLASSAGMSAPAAPMPAPGMQAASADPNQSSKGALLSLFKTQAMKNKAAAAEQEKVSETSVAEPEQATAPTPPPAPQAGQVRKEKSSMPNLSTYGNFGLGRRAAAGQQPQTPPPARTTVQTPPVISKPTAASVTPQTSMTGEQLLQTTTVDPPQPAIPEAPKQAKVNNVSKNNPSISVPVADRKLGSPTAAGPVPSSTQRAFAAYASAKKHS